MGTVFSLLRLKLTGGRVGTEPKTGRQGPLALSRQVTVKPGQSAASAERVNQSKAERCRSLQSRGHWIEVIPSHRLLTLSAGLRGVIGADKGP